MSNVYINEYLRGITKEELEEIYELATDYSHFSNKLLNIYNAENELIFNQKLSYLPTAVIEEFINKCEWEIARRYFNR